MSCACIPGDERKVVDGSVRSDTKDKGRSVRGVGGREWSKFNALANDCLGISGRADEGEGAWRGETGSGDRDGIVGGDAGVSVIEMGEVATGTSGCSFRSDEETSPSALDDDSVPVTERADGTDGVGATEEPHVELSAGSSGLAIVSLLSRSPSSPGIIMADARCSASDCERPVTVEVSPSNDGGGTRFDGVAEWLWSTLASWSVVALGSASASSWRESPPRPFAGCTGSGLRITLKRRARRPMKLLCFSFLPDPISALRSADGDRGGPAVDLRRSIFCR